MFSFLLSFRTKNTEEHVQEIIDKTFNQLAQYDEKIASIRDKGYRIGIKNAASRSLSIIAREVLNAYDLEAVLLINCTQKKFITSDNPAIRYNQFLEQRKHPGGHLGIYAKGLQLFLPLSPEIMIAYYDKWAYKFGNRKDRNIRIIDENDVNQLNHLQVVNCTELIFSNNLISSFYLSSISEKSKKIRAKDLTVSYELGRRIDEEGYERIQYTQYSEDRKIKLNLSFIKYPQKAKSHILSDFMVQIRNESMRYNRP